MKQLIIQMCLKYVVQLNYMIQNKELEESKVFLPLNTGPARCRNSNGPPDMVHCQLFDRPLRSGRYRNHCFKRSCLTLKFSGVLNHFCMNHSHLSLVS